jgi:hypothetical protein
MTSPSRNVFSLFGDTYWTNLKEAEPLQHELFQSESNLRGCVSFSNIEKLDQRRLLSLLVKFSIKSVIDIRKVNVFSAPHYDHVRISDHFFHYGINYLQYVPIPAGAPNTNTFFFDAVRSEELDRMLRAGPVAVLYDSKAQNAGNIAAMRAMLSSLKAFRAEFHPTAI